LHKNNGTNILTQSTQNTIFPITVLRTHNTLDVYSKQTVCRSRNKSHMVPLTEH